MILFLKCLTVFLGAYLTVVIVCEFIIWMDTGHQKNRKRK